MTDLPALPALPGARGVQPVARRGWQQALVVAITAQTPTVKVFRLALPDWQAHLPGQYYVVRLTAPDGYRAQRSYSVASPPEQPPDQPTEQHRTIDLAVERLADGEVSGFLHDGLAVGDELEVRGPLGGWFVWTGDRPALLVGGGSGVVPLMAVLRSHRARRLDVGLHLVVSARSRDDLVFADELLAAPTGAERVDVVLTRSAPAHWPRPVGRLVVDDLRGPVRATGVADAARATSYVCGSAGFASAAEELLVAAGADTAGIRVERFG